MAPILSSLAWKEWREQRWKLAFGSALLACVTAIGLRARMVEDVGVHAIALGVGGFLLPLFAAMGLVAGERAEGSLATLLAQPVRPRVVLAVKLAMGAVVSLAPVGTALLVALAIARDRELAYPVTLRAYLSIAAAGLMTFVWSCGFSSREPTEARAGLVGLGVVAVLGFTAPLADHAYDLRNCPWHPFALIDALVPWTRSNWQGLPRYNWMEPLAWQCGLAAALLAWAGWRFGRRAR